MLRVQTIWQHVLELVVALIVVLGALTAIILANRALRINRGAKKKTNKLSTRARLEIYLAYSHLGETIEIVQAIVSIIAVCIFVYGSYLDPTKRAPTWYPWVELILTIFFTMNWLLDFYLSKDKLRYIYSLFSIVDLLTILPIYENILIGGFLTELDNFQFLRVLRTLRILRVNRILHRFDNEIAAYIFKTITIIFTIVFVIAGFYMNIEYNPMIEGNPPLKFHEAVYFLVVTLSTVGYGDIHPTTSIGQMTILLIICIGAVLVPYLVSQLSDKLSSYSPYGRDFSNTGLAGHTVVCGEITYPLLLEFLLEFYHEKYARHKKEVVVLCPNTPSQKIKSLLLHPFYKHRLFYLLGSPMYERDLQRARISKAESCMIFHPPSLSASDANTILANLAVKSLTTNLPIYSQIIRHESKLKLPQTFNRVFCSEEYRTAILAQNCLCPGYASLLSNLFTTRKEIPDLVDPWRIEYSYGCLNNIYRTSIPRSFHGESLGDVTRSMYLSAGALVIGIEERDTHKRVWLHPPFDTELGPHLALIVLSHNIYNPALRAIAVAEAGSFPSQSATEGDPTSSDKKSVWDTLFNFLFLPDLTPTNRQDFANTTAKTDEVENLLINENIQIDKKGRPRKPHEMAIEMEPLGLSKFAAISESPSLSSSGGVILLSSPHRNDESTNIADNNASSSSSNNNNNNNNNNTNTNTNTNTNIGVSRSEEISQKRILPRSSSSFSNFSGQQFHLQKFVEKHYDGNWRALLDDFNNFTGIGVGPWPVENSSEEQTPLAMGMENHIILCGEVTGLEMFLKAMRATSFDIVPIVILHSEDPPEKVWSRVKHLKRIYYVKGSSLDRRDLEKCNIRTAAQILILSKPYNEYSGDDTDTTSVDSDTIMTYLDVLQVVKPTCVITVELVSESNCRFLKNGGSSRHTIKKRRISMNYNSKEVDSAIKPNYYLTPEFAAGHVCSFGFLDTLMCQVQSQDYLYEVAKEFVFGVNGLGDVYKSQIDGDPGIETTSNCFAMPLDIPSELAGKTYGELFEFTLFTTQALPIGLYRTREVHSSPQPYVFTCPPKNTIVHRKDKLIVFINQKQ